MAKQQAPNSVNSNEPQVCFNPKNNLVEAINPAACAHYNLTEQAIVGNPLANILNFAEDDYDTLTGLPNRKLLTDRLEQGILDAKRHRQKMALLFLDLDGFKAVNDTYGHSAGDDLLKKVARLIENNIREGDTLARIGGDEFVILLKDILQHNEQLAGIERVAQKIINQLSEPFYLEGHCEAEAEIGGSIGIAIFPQDAHTSKDLLQHADMAMYRAKNNGRNQLAFYQSEMDQEAHERLQQENQLRNLLKNELLTIAFDPVFDTLQKTVVLLDAQIQLQENSHDAYELEALLKNAETSFLGIDLSEWQLSETLSVLKNLEQTQPDLAMAVRVNPMHFRQKQFVEWLENQLNEYGVNPELLVLELSETCLSLQTINLTERINALAKLGVQLHIENFGAGFTSLKYLSRLDVSAIRVTGFFSERLNMSRASESMVSAILAFGYQLNLQRIACGIRSAEQLSFIQSQQCNFAQGPLFGSAIKAEELDTFIIDLHLNDWQFDPEKELKLD